MFGAPIELLTADPQNKPDTAAAIVRKWYANEGVDMIIDMPTSATALAGMELSKQFEKVMIVTDAASSDITGKSCSPYTAHWTYDTYSNAHTVGGAIVKNGGDSWFFITADYVFGHSIERDTAEVVKAAGGKVLGSVRHPLNTPDFSSYLLQAQSSKAKIIGLANGGGDTINAIKQAGEFGIVSGGQNLAAIVMFISDVHSLGLKLAQGLIITEAYYWDLNDKTRAFGRRFFERMKRMPTMNQAATYSATLHYLKAVQAAGTRETKPVMAKMRATPVRDAFTDNGVLREDGRMVHSMFLFEVKKPEESKGPWDYYKVLAEVSGDQAFRPLNEGGCPLVR
jgi:branched-chain amino acid transport system substrate-binding protein